MTRRQRQIVNAVSAVSGVPVSDILGRHRYHAVIPARQAAQYLMAQDGGPFNSHTAIGKAFGREHTTVWWGIVQSKRDIAVGGPRSVIIRRSEEILASKERPAPAQPEQQKTTPHHGAMPRIVKRVTSAGWMEADGSLVVAP